MIQKPDGMIICPKCEGEILDRGNALICEKCNIAMRLDSGMIVLNENDDFYWGEIPLEEMERVLVRAREKGWRRAIDETEYKVLEQSLHSEDRIDWVDWVRKERMAVLDVGSGMGQVSFLLARVTEGPVISLEKISQRASFQAIRKEQEKVDNLLVINGGILQAPLRKNSFDLVAYIGTLEWVGVEGAPRSPRSVQLTALKKTHALLRQGGHVCIGIENRIGINNFLGSVDHSGLRFTSLMPRKLADAYINLRNPSFRANRSTSSYRTYTYSAWGYTNLLNEAGFKDIRILIAHPHYAHPRSLIEMKNSDIRRFFRYVYKPTSMKDFVKFILFRIMSFFHVATILAPHFVIIGKK